MRALWALTLLSACLRPVSGAELVVEINGAAHTVVWDAGAPLESALSSFAANHKLAPDAVVMMRNRMTEIDSMASTWMISTDTHGAYVSACEEAVQDDGKFATFKSDPRYTQVLEHTLEETARAYIERIREQTPWLLGPALLASFRAKDQVGRTGASALLPYGAATTGDNPLRRPSPIARWVRRISSISAVPSGGCLQAQ
jgi:hypothetical protein